MEFLFAAELSKRLVFLDENELKYVERCCASGRKTSRHSNIDAKDIIEAFKFDKKQPVTHFSGFC